MTTKAMEVAVERAVNVHEIFLAADTQGALKPLAKAMLYQPPDRYIDYRREAPEWAELQRKWDRPAAMFASHRMLTNRRGWPAP